jgi:hypothetical protein
MKYREKPLNQNQTQYARPNQKKPSIQTFVRNPHLFNPLEYTEYALIYHYWYKFRNAMRGDFRYYLRPLHYQLIKHHNAATSSYSASP